MGNGPVCKLKLKSTGLTVNQLRSIRNPVADILINSITISTKIILT